MGMFNPDKDEEKDFGKFPKKTDSEYRDDLIRGGVRADLIETRTGHDLDCIGNIVQIYRTSMQEQDPIAFRIRQFAVARGLKVDIVEDTKLHAAFPSGDGQFGGGPNHDPGMTIRDYFAGRAMQVIFSTDAIKPYEDRMSLFEISNNSYRLADAMLRERERK